MIVFAGLGNYAASGPNPVAATIGGDVGQEGDFAAAVLSAVLCADKEASAPAFVCGEELGLAVGEVARIVNLEKAFQRMTVSEFLLKIVVLRIVYLEAGVCGIASPCSSAEMAFPGFVGLVVVNFGRPAAVSGSY